MVLLSWISFYLIFLHRSDNHLIFSLSLSLFFIFITTGLLCMACARRQEQVTSSQATRTPSHTLNQARDLDRCAWLSLLSASFIGNAKTRGFSFSNSEMPLKARGVVSLAGTRRLCTMTWIDRPGLDGRGIRFRSGRLVPGQAFSLADFYFKSFFVFVYLPIHSFAYMLSIYVVILLSIRIFIHQTIYTIYRIHLHSSAYHLRCRKMVLE